jgi:Leucine-rich repeat (LRR) protein
VTEIGSSAAFKNVTSFIVRDNLLTTLDGLEQFENLEFLDIANNENLSSLTVLEHLKKLEVLQVGYAPNLKRQIMRMKIMRPEVEIREV